MRAENAHLHDAVAQLEHNDVLQPMIGLHVVHALCSLGVLKHILVLPIQLLHHIRFEVLQKIDLRLEFLRIRADVITESLRPRWDVVDMSRKELSIEMLEVKEDWRTLCQVTARCSYCH